MEMHRYEKLWLMIGVGTLVAFFLLLVYSQYAMGFMPADGHATIDSTKVDQTPPFNQPGVFKKSDKEYEVVLVALAFGFTPNVIEVPVGSTVHFKVTSKDVVHGFEIPMTRVNAMVLPGHVTETSYTFKKPGEYLILCNEYCGVGHHMMMGKLRVTE
ncbi:cytochrome c oxidase subunit II [Calditerricola satsumensis]|uniref:Cytochrome aa3 subunit 2 n=1 Tax=Calditerricola satsumensis TaxID=373054 RepID=A0A8J3BB74_9BACI|nr:cytochrome c oxidase subunit II [Calditerricola satsumensis]GGJ98366.1 cytochrome c oxidase subunit 2 [Calditerricola satsumensis]